jgi:hypothetical protein
VSRAYCGRQLGTAHDERASPSETKSQFTFTAELRQRDGIEPGQQFEIERIDRGECRLVRRKSASNEGQVEWLVACPKKRIFRRHRALSDKVSKKRGR